MKLVNNLLNLSLFQISISRLLNNPIAWGKMPEE